MIDTIKDPDLFRVENQFDDDRYTKRLGINPLVKRCGTNPSLRSLVLPGINLSSYHNFLHTFIIPAGLSPTEANKPSAVWSAGRSVLAVVGLVGGGHGE
jgi:hypothetical protein